MGLDPAEVERMRKEAEAHAAEDKKKVELIEARNHADQAVFQVEKLLKDHGDKLSQQDKDAIQSAVEKTKQAMSGDDVQAIKQASSDLAVATQALAAHVQGGGPGGGHQGGGSSADGGAKGGKDDVIDAEYEVKK